MNVVRRWRGGWSAKACGGQQPVEGSGSHLLQSERPKGSVATGAGTFHRCRFTFCGYENIARLEHVSSSLSSFDAEWRDRTRRNTHPPHTRKLRLANPDVMGRGRDHSNYTTTSHCVSLDSAARNLCYLCMPRGCLHTLHILEPHKGGIRM